MDTFSWITSLSVWLAFSMTTFLVASRVALIWLLRLYKYEQIHPATWYLIVLVVLQVPYVSSLIHLLWNTPFISKAKGQALPNPSRLALGVLTSILEAVATAMFATEVAHVVPEPVLLTLPYSTLAFVILKDILRDYRSYHGKPSRTSCMKTLQARVSTFMGLLVVCYSFLIATAVGVVLCAWTDFRFSIEACIVLSTCVLVLSAVWSPTVQRHIILSHTTRQRCTTVDLLYIPIKATAVTVSVFLSLFFKLNDFRTYLTECMLLAIHEFSDIRVCMPVVICCLCAFSALMSAGASSKVCLVQPGMKIPMCLCPLLTVLVTAILWNDFETQAFWEVTGEDVYSWIAIGLSTVTWLLPFFLPVFRGFRNPKTSDRDLSESFYTFSWNPFFLEPRGILNYEASSVSQTLFHTLSTHKTNLHRKKTVFICTTMYKENEKEMKRYLRSIQNVFANNNKEILHMEAHVFFDSSVHKDKINPKGRLLLSLLCDMFQIDHSDLEKLATPYGCQVHTKTLKSYTVYIHFKDVEKVKSKKRWSQVMYMHYILRFRNFSYQQTSVQTNWLSSSEIIKQYEESALQLENVFHIHRPSMINLCGSEASSPFSKYTWASAMTASDINYVSMKGHSLITEHGHRVQDVKPWCCSESCSSKASMHSKQNYVNKNRDNLTVPVLASACRPFPGSDSSGQRLGLSKNAEGAGPKSSCARQSSFSTESSDKDFSSSSDVDSNKTFSSLEESSSGANSKTSVKSNVSSLDDVFLLTTDADTEFSANSIRHLLEQCESDESLGAVCGRTVPIGSAKPIVWYQKFEYAKDFWLVKSSQNVIGSVTCCPGCFSIYRGSAVASVAEEFSQPASSAFDNLVMDHGEDRWLCTLLMQHGWRLAYSSHAQNSTHCPETIGEFLRQRRRWVLSELSNMAAIFLTVPSLVRNNAYFSGMFLISLFTTFLWVILSPSTTLVFMCAGMEVLFSVSMAMTLPSAMTLFLGYCGICCFASQRKQKLVSLTLTFVMVLTVLTLAVGFIMYVVLAVERDLQTWGSVQFQPYFLVFFLIACIVYAALLHPSESLSLVYGLAYALLFPAMFVVLPGYALSNMLDQSWGTRESGSHGCCQEPNEDEDEQGFSDFLTTVSSLPSLASFGGRESEDTFWKQLIVKYIGTDVNRDKSRAALTRDLHRLRRWAVTIFVIVNLIWFTCLSALYVFAGSDIICYCVAAMFSFSLLVQLVGLTCYKCNTFLNRYLLVRANVFVTQASKH